jgi:ADP-ribose pyrophosphatase YjhB (NUDIX family)
LETKSCQKTEGGNLTWIDEKDWNIMQQVLPIVCIDILPIERNPDGSISHVGLILRDTPHEGEKWCSVGGRLLYGESVQDGVIRQLKDTLGRDIEVKEQFDSQPTYVAQYSPTLEHQEQFDAIDPRKHAVALTYCLEIHGRIHAQNEALDFHWYTVEEIQDKQDIGFFQKSVILNCLKRL